MRSGDEGKSESRDVPALYAVIPLFSYPGGPRPLKLRAVLETESHVHNRSSGRRHFIRSRINTQLAASHPARFEHHAVAGRIAPGSRPQIAPAEERLAMAGGFGRPQNRWNRCGRTPQADIAVAFVLLAVRNGDFV